MVNWLTSPRRGAAVRLGGTSGPPRDPLSPMVRPQGGASRRRTAAACRGLQRGEETAKRQVAWRGVALFWMPIHPNWSTADGGHFPRGALLTHVERPLSSLLFTHGFCRGTNLPLLALHRGSRLARLRKPHACPAHAEAFSKANAAHATVCLNLPTSDPHIR